MALGVCPGDSCAVTGEDRAALSWMLGPGSLVRWETLDLINLIWMADLGLIIFKYFLIVFFFPEYSRKSLH